MNNISSPLSNKKYDHFIGIDIGIASSYISLFSNALTKKNHRQSEQFEAGDICSQSTLLSMKSDSIGSYDDSLKHRHKFSKKVFSRGRKPKAKGTLYRNFPFLLYEIFDPKSHDATLKNINDTEKIIEVTANYLRGFIQEFLTEVKSKYYGHRICKSELCYVITVPQLCPVRTRALLVRSIIKAGLVSTHDIPQRVSFISEMKAAARYCYQSLRKSFRLNAPQRFMLLDSRGRTMNASIFDIESPQPKNGPLLKEIQAHAQTDCGLINIAEEFKYLISQKFEDDAFTPLSQVDLDNMTDDFIKNKMRELSSQIDEFEPDKSVLFPVPISCHFPPSFVNVNRFVENNSLRVTHDELYKSVFKGIISKIIDLISHLLKKLPVNEQNIDAIQFVGDFDQLPWLFKEIRDNFEGKSIGANSILEVPDGEFAACNGAIFYGLGL